MVLSSKMLRFNLSVCSKINLMALIALLLAACSHDPSSVVVTDLRSPPTVTSGSHIVREGETLYSIAWMYGRDFRELADNNSIRSPFLIHPGQTISLNQRSRPVAAPPKRTSSPAKKQVVKKTTPVRKPPASPMPTQVVWQWPAKGNVIKGFALKGSVNKGIDIGGKLGEPVVAAAAGEVVYSGSDLAGYGRLVIMKHNNSYLSAYAHNRELLVREGDSVKAGQKIAEIGSTGTTEPKLHFEIRRDGKPVDPMRFLPTR